MQFKPIASDILFQRNDLTDPRWGEKLSEQFEECDWVLRGYPDEEGIRLNGGRLGAAEGPSAIRRAFYKTTWKKDSPRLFDQGDLDLSTSLEERHLIAQNSLSQLLTSGKRVICLGGGHDYGYPDGAGFLDSCLSAGKPKPLVLNFDAHLDVRPLDRGLSSGTPFFRLLSQYTDFEFFEIGIQPQCNSEAHIKWCREQGGKILTWPEVLCNTHTLSEQVRDLIAPSLTSVKPPCFISLDIDCFENSAAPGCSQSWPTGISPNHFYAVLEMLKQLTDIRVFGIYEVSPRLDIDHRTSKLAAQWIHQLLRKNS